MNYSNKIELNETQAQVGIVAGMWTQEDLDKAKQRPTKLIKQNYYLNGNKD